MRGRPPAARLRRTPPDATHAVNDAYRSSLQFIPAIRARRRKINRE
ncbi:hypothetical protein C7S17_3435 [Burkholderia thailandensis]|nr:hypothetical protein [Burkholderia thailandensis]